MRLFAAYIVDSRCVAGAVPRQSMIRGLSTAFVAVVSLIRYGVFAQQKLPPPLQGAASSDVPVAVQILRWHMLDSEVNSLTFRSMDTLFTTALFPRSGCLWEPLGAESDGYYIMDGLPGVGP